MATSSASQPSMVAIMLEQLDVRPGAPGAGDRSRDRLERGADGPDRRCRRHVTTIDIDPDPVATAAGRLADVAEVICGDGALGRPDGAPYDRIVLTVGGNAVARPRRGAGGGRR